MFISVSDPHYVHHCAVERCMVDRKASHCRPIQLPIEQRFSGKETNARDPLELKVTFGK
jgi:hypothetical protein